MKPYILIRECMFGKVSYCSPRYTEVLIIKYSFVNTLKNTYICNQTN